MAEAMLDCVICGGRKWQTFEGTKADELRSTGAIRLPCAACNRETYWKVADHERRAEEDRRTQPEARRSQPADLAPGHAAAQIQPERRNREDRRESVHRRHDRVPLRLPIRVRVEGWTLRFNEVTNTINVSRNGVCFQSSQPFEKGAIAHVTLNYSPENPGSNIEQRGTVVRVDVNAATGGRRVAILLG